MKFFIGYRRWSLTLCVSKEGNVRALCIRKQEKKGVGLSQQHLLRKPHTTLWLLSSIAISSA